MSLTQAAAIELGPHGITVNAICPGYVLTEMGAATRTPEMVAAWRATSPLGRCAEPSDVAGDGPVPGVGRRRLLHRPGDQRHRRDDHALRLTVMTVPLTERRATDRPGRSGRRARRSRSTGVSKTFPDGTHALATTTFSVARASS